MQVSVYLCNFLHNYASKKTPLDKKERKKKRSKRNKERKNYIPLYIFLKLIILDIYNNI